MTNYHNFSVLLVTKSAMGDSRNTYTYYANVLENMSFTKDGEKVEIAELFHQLF